MNLITANHKRKCTLGRRIHQVQPNPFFENLIPFSPTHYELGTALSRNFTQHVVVVTDVNGAIYRSRLLGSSCIALQSASSVRMEVGNYNHMTSVARG
jgi:hypothetical protein